jgi:hypothetical protein
MRMGARFIWFRIQTSANSYEHGNEPSVFMKSGERLDSLTASWEGLCSKELVSPEHISYLPFSFCSLLT